MYLAAVLVGGVLLITGSLPLRKGTLQPNNVNRVAGALIICGFLLPFGWLGALFGNESLGKIIILVSGVTALVIGMFYSLSRGRTS